MKKFLSLVLALVMTMSLVTVSAGAKDFTDDKSITYDEAVAVMSEVKVIDGYTDGSFQPTTLLTRGAAAKIICNLILGPTTAAALGADTAPYSDVPVNHTFAGYIAYCQKTGIISGYADGTFKPAASLTGYAFMKMLLGALGYDSDVEGYTGPNWSINVAKQAIAIGLAKGNDDFTGQAYVNREEACLYSLNTLKATMVEYPQTTTVTVNGADVVLASARTEVAWGTALKSNDGHIKKDGYVQFAEKYFPNLELEVGEGIYGRPANTWKNKKSEIGTFTSIDPTYVYTESMEEADVYKDLGGVITDKDEYDWSFYINGVEQKTGTIPAKNNDDEWVYTGEGTVTEVYVNDLEETVDVVEFNYYLGQVSKVKSDDDGEYITVSVLSKGAKDLDNKTFYVEGYAEDDYVVFTMDWDDDEDEYVIGEVFEPETVTGTVTRVDKDTKNANNSTKVTGETYLKMDSDKYVYSEDAKDPAQQSHMVYDLSENTNVVAHPTLDEDYIVYLDPNGYVLGFAPAEETVDQFLFVTDSDEELRDWIAKVYLPDATNPKVELDDELEGTLPNSMTVPSLGKPIKFSSTKDSIEWIDDDGNLNNDWKQRTNVDGLIWKYSVDSKGVYSLTYVPVATSETAENGDLRQYYMDSTPNDGNDNNDVEIHNGKAYVEVGQNAFIVDNKTIFVDTMNGVAYTGYKEVPNVDYAEIAYVMDGKIASVVFILDGEIYDSASTYFMLKNTDRESFRYDGDDFWTYENAYVNGEKTPLNIKYNADKSGSNVLKADTLYKVIKTVDEDYITEVKEITTVDFAKKTVVTVGVDAFWARTAAVQQSADKYDVNDETVFVVVDYALQKDGSYKLDAIYDGRLDDMDDDDYSIKVQVLKQDEQTAELVYIYRHEKAAPAEPKVSNVTFNGEAVSAYTSAEQAYKNAIEYVPGTNFAVDFDYVGTSSNATAYWQNFSSASDSFTSTSTYNIGDKSASVGAGVVQVFKLVNTVNGETDVRYIAVKGSNDMVTLTITNSAANPVRITVNGGEGEILDANGGANDDTTVTVKKGASITLTVEMGNGASITKVEGTAQTTVFGADGTYTVSVDSAAMAPVVTIS